MQRTVNLTEVDEQLHAWGHPHPVHECSPESLAPHCNVLAQINLQQQGTSRVHRGRTATVRGSKPPATHCCLKRRPQVLILDLLGLHPMEGRCGGAEVRAGHKATGMKHSCCSHNHAIFPERTQSDGRQQHLQ